MSTKQNVRPFGWADRIGYAFGDFGNDFTFMLSSGFMMKFYTDIMGINAAVVGLLMMAARFVDAVTDVTMGQIVDRSKPTKDGKFRPWIKRMCGPVAIASFLIYQGGLADMAYGFKVVYMVVTYLLWGSIFYTSINIPYGSMASAISEDPDDRASLSTWRNIGATMASLSINAGIPLVAYVVVDGNQVLDPTRMLIVAAACSIGAIICYILCFNLVRERVDVPQNTTKLNVGHLLKSLVTNRSLIGIIVAAILLLLAQLGMNGMAAYVYPNYYGNVQAQSLASILGSVATLVICAPLAGKLSSKYGKKEVSAIAAIGGAIAFLICLVIRPDNAYVYALFATLGMIGIGFFNMVVWAMITDVIDDAEVKNGVREDGTIYSVYSFARKVGQALSSGMVGGLLSIIGYTEAAAFEPDVTLGIFRISCIVPIIGFVLVALALIFVYPLSKAKVDANVAYLRAKREGKK